MNRQRVVYIQSYGEVAGLQRLVERFNLQKSVCVSKRQGEHILPNPPPIKRDGHFCDVTEVRTVFVNKPWGSHLSASA